MNLQDVHDNKEIVDEVDCVSALSFKIDIRGVIGHLKFNEGAS